MVGLNLESVLQDAAVVRTSARDETSHGALHLASRPPNSAWESAPEQARECSADRWFSRFALQPWPNGGLDVWRLGDPEGENILGIRWDSFGVIVLGTNGCRSDLLAMINEAVALR